MSIFCFRGCWSLLPQVQQAEVEMRLGTIGVHHFRGNQFAIRAVKRISLILSHGIRIDPRECADRFYAHCTNGITEQRGDRLNNRA